ncbi:DUF642 domain-containing protein [Pseudoalteromonas sp. MEBiC 03607]|jgi:hypothetical protein|uniref:DUF642 domain-containing protein n=1 Tax=unclassified Pseudoalteromonas TaxID=194690 RepID=UPI000C5CB512|nr:MULTISPECIES: DUF642 domain-containing protein [unclassified Pseudoalteromonas]MBU77196.1 hemolysin-type calcium-binding protein [Pseudoalteromonadaceae bacterium]MCO7250836.1 DUF642 domain-containing protein [Pseudoalteromonas sp. Ps84H-4]TGV21058.1 DUF642 domain-containing protein [Pseudoalteromonas sp. MEBiC 03607]|tara:strand:- start:4238 stop:5470 length:1233 start_codon:yes stop_codon:yes gene_type:complete
MKNLVCKLAVLPLAVASAFAVANTNLVENGSFEAEVVSGQWQLFNEITGWTRSANAPFEVQTNSLGILKAKDGQQYLELGSTQQYSVSQVVSTEAGKMYEFSFYYSARASGDDTASKVEVFWNGESLGVVNAKFKGWTKYSFTVEASEASSEITLKGIGTGGSTGGFIDNVSVAEVAEYCSVKSGLYAINKFGSDTEGYIYHLDPETSAVSPIAGVTNTAANIAGKDGKLYFMEQLDSETRDSKIYSLDLETNTQSELADTNSYTITRSTVSPDGLNLRATSKTYMYDFNLETGAKEVLGKFSFEGEEFTGGDIAYSYDNNVLYLLTDKALYTVDESTLELTLVGEHGVNWASGLAVADDGTIYVTGRKSGQSAKLYTLDQNTAEATFVLRGPAHLNDLTYISESVCSVE